MAQCIPMMDRGLHMWHGLLQVVYGQSLLGFLVSVIGTSYELVDDHPFL